MRTAIEIIYLMNSKGVRRKSQATLLQTHGSLSQIDPDTNAIETLTNEIAESEKQRNSSCELNSLDKAYISGLVDGDGTFNVAFKSNCKIQLTFAVGMSKDSRNLLTYLQRLFEVGKVCRLAGHFYRYQVQNVHDINSRILPFFDDNSFLTHKKEHYKTFVQIVKLCIEKDREIEFKQ